MSDPSYDPFEELRARDEHLKELIQSGVSQEELLRYMDGNPEIIDAAEQLAMIDPLTGLLNRRGYTTQASARIQAFERRFYQNHNPSFILGQALIDVNDFKFINDTFGHEEGDYLLGVISERLRKNTRQSGLLGRLCGDEFVYLFEASSYLGTTQDAAEEARYVGKKLTAELDCNLIHEVTMSMGLALWEPGDTTSTFLSKADQAMYYAKKNPNENGLHYHVYTPEIEYVQRDQRRRRPKPSA